MIWRAVWPAIARADVGPDEMIKIAAWGGITIMALLAIWFAAAWLRRKTSRPPAQPNPWTLDGLRQLRKAGLLDDDEYARMRQVVADAFKSAAGRKTDDARHVRADRRPQPSADAAGADSVADAKPAAQPAEPAEADAVADPAAAQPDPAPGTNDELREKDE